MFWQLTLEDTAEAQRAQLPPEGRFVLHRHHDADGPHLDLRLEQDGYCLGWRVGAAELDGAPWASAKAPHPLAWLEHDGDAVRADHGVYAWVERHADGGRLLLMGARGDCVLRVSRVAGLPPDTVRAVHEAVRACGGESVRAAQLVRDGMAARQRAIARLLGLGRELDGAAFDETVWRASLADAPLDAINAHLRAYEARFDAKYPPRPVSEPEPLEAEDRADRGADALRIAREVNPRG